MSSVAKLKNRRYQHIFAIFFLLTGVFALLGGLYTWGDGVLFSQTQLAKVLIPWADVLLTAPLSIASGIGLMRKKQWAYYLAAATSGIYLFGTALVFISMIWNRDYSVFLIVPASSGGTIALLYLSWVIKGKAQRSG
jgi:hypothetical protein